MKFENGCQSSNEPIEALQSLNVISKELIPNTRTMGPERMNNKKIVLET
jgi:hypothetical protein